MSKINTIFDSATVPAVSSNLNPVQGFTEPIVGNSALLCHVADNVAFLNFEKNSILTSESVSCKKSVVVNNGGTAQNKMASKELVTPALLGTDKMEPESTSNRKANKFDLLSYFYSFLCLYLAKYHPNKMADRCCLDMLKFITFSGLCKYHLRYGSKAHHCVGPCRWISLAKKDDVKLCQFHVKQGAKSRKCSKDCDFFLKLDQLNADNCKRFISYNDYLLSNNCNICKCISTLILNLNFYKTFMLFIENSFINNNLYDFYNNYICPNITIPSNDILTLLHNLFLDVNFCNFSDFFSHIIEPKQRIKASNPTPAKTTIPESQYVTPKIQNSIVPQNLPSVFSDLLLCNMPKGLNKEFHAALSDFLGSSIYKGFCNRNWPKPSADHRNMTIIAHFLQCFHKFMGYAPPAPIISTPTVTIKHRTLDDFVIRTFSNDAYYSTASKPNNNINNKVRDIAITNNNNIKAAPNNNNNIISFTPSDNISNNIDNLANLANPNHRMRTIEGVTGANQKIDVGHRLKYLWLFMDITEQTAKFCQTIPTQRID